jgi:glucose-6-phosphate 1-dehydrogenase
VTCTEIVIRLRQTPSIFKELNLTQNHFRIRISPDIAVAFGLNVMAPLDEKAAVPVEVLGSHFAHAEEMDAYERVLGDAMAGDATLFARQDYVEEAWRIVDPALQASTPVFEYEPKTWGPKEVASVTPPGGWHNPVIEKGIRL